MPKKRRKSDSIPVLTKKLDAVFSKWIRQRACDENGMVKCFTCDYQNVPEKLQAGHFIPRQYRSTRWDLDNVKPQCFSCNMYYGGRPQDFRDGLIELLGEDRVKRLEQARFRLRSYDREGLKHLIRMYKELIE